MNILLIAPQAYNYYKDIIQYCTKKGDSVDYIQDFEPTFVNRSIRYLSRKLIKWKQNRYIKSVLINYNKPYDIVFIIRGYAYNRDSIEYIKKKFSDAKFILYQWDPLSISLFDTHAIDLFDEALTFDFADSEKYSLRQKSLFYSEEYNNDISCCELDYSFIGTNHSIRIPVLLKLYENSLIKSNHIIKLFCPNLKLLVGLICKYNLFKRAISLNWLISTPIPRAESQSIFDKSKCIIDIHDPRQNGLSIRVIEVLSKNKKLITTNKNIIREKFYNPNMIFVIDIANPIIPKDFIKRDNQYISIDYLRIDNWLDDVIYQL